jgi:hypothetical protein
LRSFNGEQPLTHSISPNAELFVVIVDDGDGVPEVGEEMIRGDEAASIDEMLEVGVIGGAMATQP